jgi:uncharacterized protein (DUF302 family)
MTASIERSTVLTGLTYPALVAAFERELGRWEPDTGTRLVAARAPWSEVEREVERAAGPHGLMILGQVDQGEIVSLSGRPIRCSLYLIGNPVIAARILQIDVRGSLYVPFRVSLYEERGADGASIAFDRPSSFLAALERPELVELGRVLDEKIDGLAAAAAR